MNKKNNVKRLLCLMLAFCLMLSIVPIFGITVLAGEEQTGYKVTFVKDEHVDVTVYPTQDLTQNGTTNLENIFARLSNTGEIDTSGDGQVNFTVTVAEGYVLNSIQATPTGNYKNFKDPEELQIDAYRITKITGDLTVTITTRSASGGDEDSCEHVYEDNWEVVQAPKCGVAGTEHRFCTQCGKGEQTQEIPALSHSYENDYCKHCGVIHPDKIVALNQIDFYIAKDSSNGLDGDVHVELKTSNNQYTGTIYLPGSVDLTKAFLKWNPSNSVIVKGSNQTQYTSGQAPIAAKGGSVTYTVTCGSNSASFTFTTQQGSENVQGMFFEIDESKGTIDAMNTDESHNTECKGGVTLDGQSYFMKLKGHGNSSWTYNFDKKPYNLTLYKTEDYGDKASAELISHVKTKKWVLLANAKDNSLLRNRIALALGNKLGIGMETRYVDCWVNGEYWGNYLLTPKTDYQAPKNGYFVEIDNKDDEEDPQFKIDGFSYSDKKVLFTVKDNGSNQSVEDIQSYIQKVANAILDTNSTKYLDYIDLDSWAKMYLVNELYKDIDVVAGSNFMYRNGIEDTDKLYAGPIWDFDGCLGRTHENNYSGVPSNDQKTADGWYIDSVNTSCWLQSLAKHNEFIKRVYELYNEYKADFDALPQYIAEQEALIADSAKMNYTKFEENQTVEDLYGVSSSNKTIGTGTYVLNYTRTSKWADYVSNFKLFVNKRLAFLSDNLTVEAPVATMVEEEIGGSTVLSVNLSSSSQNVTYQWQFSTDGIQWENLNNGTTSTIDISDELYLSYRCIVTNNGQTINTSRVAKVPTASSVILTRANTIGYVARFACDENASVTAFDTQDTSGTGRTDVKYAVPRDADSGEADFSGEGQVNFRVQTKQGYNIKEITVTPGNYKNLKTIDAENQVYRVTKISGPITINVVTAECEHQYQNGNCIHCGKAEFDGMIDFTSQESEKYYSIENQSAAKRTENGLYLISTKDAFEPANDQLSGSSSTTPKDVVKIPAEGDWTATIKVNFNQNSSQGYYEFFGFYAMDDYQNLVGIRAGDGSIQDFIRKNGTITKETSGKKTSTGLKSASTHYFRIKKSGDDYECYWSKDGENFTFIFSYEDTGITGETICLDAYSGMATGYTYQIEYLYLEKPFVPPTYREGDLNGDTVISKEDSLLAKRAAMKDPTLEITEAAIAAGDFNEDGKITVNEARRIMRMTMEQENAE